MLHQLNTIRPLSVALWERLTLMVERKAIKKNGYLQKPGQIANSIYFIESGLIRSYHLSNGKEITSAFYKEGDLLVSLTSFCLQMRAYDYFKALESSTLYSLSYRDLQMIFQTFPEFNFHIRELIGSNAMHVEECLHAFRSQRASERYEWLISHSPDLVERVPAKYLASYIGITEEALGRIKGGKDG